MKKNLFFVVLIFIILFFYSNADAQCAMCKMIPESNLESGGKKGIGLNKGILYLMSIPYVLVLGIILLFRKKILEKLKSFINKEH